MSTVSAAKIASVLGLPSPTEEQVAVIAADAEPALVVAGAGAGKTETMAARVVWLVANGRVTPDRVLGLTFTRKAARQLAERVRSRLRRLAGSGLLEHLDPSGALRDAVITGEPTVQTYHAYAGRLLAEHGLRLSLQPGARLLSETASWRLAHSVVSTWDGDLETDRVPASVTAQVRTLAAELGEHLLDPERLRSYTTELTRLIENAPKAKGQRAALPGALTDVLAAQRFRTELLPLVEEYRRRKRADGALDFADQMSLAARLADEHPEVVEGERQRYSAVLLDEYQDTGHAQRVLLRSLFGAMAASEPGERNEPRSVTAVGDPAQAIYGWRGASAANLPRFATDFPRSPEGELLPAAKFGLLTSFRNPPEVLRLANGLAEPLRTHGLGVERLRARDDAESGDILAGLSTDVRSERAWIADRLARRWFAERAEHGRPPTAAVLVRRRADMAPLAAALRSEGLPVEVVGIGGLLDEPEVADLVATLRALAEPLAGTAAARLLTGARFRLGAADVAALWRRAQELAAPVEESSAAGTERAEDTGLLDALDDPGDRQRYSELGYARIQRLSGELAGLRARMDQSLPELVADIERSTQLDVEALARPDGAGREHLDAFADVVSDYVESSPTATLLSFLDYLETAEHAEDGFAPGESADEVGADVATDRVQVLTVHAAKGLEWRIVAVPHLVDGVFPARRRASSWLKTVAELPAELRGDNEDLPALEVRPGQDRKEVMTALDEHEASFAERQRLEERRLCYVALTRSERSLLVSGHWWNENSTKAKGPSDFLTEIGELLTASGQDEPIGTVEQWAEAPAEDEQNPLVSEAREVRWPADPLGERRQAVTEGADLVRAELDAVHEQAGTDERQDLEEEHDPDGWIADTDLLLAERARGQGNEDSVSLPGNLSVSQLVDLAGDPDSLARRLRRPLPSPPNSVARRGTAFHAWLERRFAGEQLLEFDDLPGAADDDPAEDAELDALCAAFERSEWAERTPHEVEVPFSTDVEGVTLRGRMDAVFADPDGGWTVVDWKTGAVPDSQALPALSVQLAAYRLAWAGLSGAPLERVRAAFHYVRSGRTIRPVDLLDAEGLAALLRKVPEQED